MQEVGYRVVAQSCYEKGSRTLLRIRNLATGIEVVLDYDRCALLAHHSLLCRRCGFKHGAVVGEGAEARATLTVVATWWRRAGAD